MRLCVCVIENPRWRPQGHRGFGAGENSVLSVSSCPSWNERLGQGSFFMSVSESRFCPCTRKLNPAAVNETALEHAHRSQWPRRGVQRGRTPTLSALPLHTRQGLVNLCRHFNFGKTLKKTKLANESCSIRIWPGFVQ